MKKLNPKSEEQSQKLRKLGKIILIIGGVLALIGFTDFFFAFNSFKSPKFFWCSSLGMPMVFVGGAMLFMGNLMKIKRYIAGETAPVAKDTLNYMGEHTKEGVSHFSEALFSGVKKAKQSDSSTNDRLEKLKELLDQNLITEEEYKKQRLRILNEI